MSRLVSFTAGVTWPFLFALLPVGLVSIRALQAQEGGPAAAMPRATPVTPAVLTADAPVATRRLARGTILRAADITIARVPMRLDARGIARPDTTPVTPGWIARRVIQRGEVLRSPAVAPAPLVAAGQPVQFTYQQDGLELTLDGVAPVAGSLGDTIPVRLGARRRVTGIVAGPARVVATDLSRTP